MTTNIFSYSYLLNSVLRKLYFWKEPSSSDKSWALEKVKDVFIREINHDPKLLEKIDFSAFLFNFFDGDRNMIKFPEFVMCEVSKMVTNILLSDDKIQNPDLTMMLDLIESVVTTGQFDRGQRLSVMFDCLHKLFLNNVALEHLQSSNFHADLAFFCAVAGSQNYTRKSASTYFINLVKFSYNDPAMNQENSDIMSKSRCHLRDIFSTLFCKFNTQLIDFYEVKSHKPKNYDIMANYCQVLIDCSRISPNWAITNIFDRHTIKPIFNVWLDLLKLLNDSKYSNIGDIAAASMEQLAFLVNQKSDLKDCGLMFEMLPCIIIEDFAKSESLIDTCDLMKMAHIILKNFRSCLLSPYYTSILIDVSILALLALLDVHSSDSGSEIVPRLIALTNQKLQLESLRKQSLMIEYAVSNAFSLGENEAFTSHSNFESILRYVTFKSANPPSEAFQPLLKDCTIPSSQALLCLIHSLRNVSEVKADEMDAEHVKNILVYIPAMLKFRGLSHNDLSTTIESFLTVLKFLESRGISQVATDCLQSVLKTLELHLVNLDPYIREEAVKGLSKLYLLDIAMVQREAVDCRVLPSVWTCVKDKDENVVVQVIHFLYQIAKCYDTGDKLNEILNHMHTNKEALIEELKLCILSSQWDTIKPTAFLLLALVTGTENVVRYAQLCTQFHCAAPVVFQFIDEIFTSKMLSVQGDIKTISFFCGLLTEGWGDLLLEALQGDNTSCLRQAVDSLSKIKGFLDSQDITSFIKEKTDSLTDTKTHLLSIEKIHLIKERAKIHLKQIFRGSSFLKLVFNNTENGGMRETENGFEEHKSTEILGEDILQASNDHLDHLDTTVEMQPYTVSRKPFALPQLIQNIIDTATTTDNFSMVNNFCSLVVFKEFLDSLPLSVLQREVYQSTDEYERNSVSIMQDINDMMDTDFQVLVRGIEKELVDMLVMEIAQIVELLNKNGDVDEDIVSSLTELRENMERISISGESFYKFVLSKRKKVFVGKADSNSIEFSPEIFSCGLTMLKEKLKEQVSTKETFSGVDGIKELTRLYALSSLKEVQSHSSAGDLNYYGDERIPSILSKPLELAFKDTHKEASDAFISSEEIIKIAESLAKAKIEKRVSLMVRSIQKMVVTCVHIAREGKRDDSILGSMSNLLNQWLCGDDDDGFDDDGDVDPTLIDCY